METVKARKVKISLTDTFLKKRQSELKTLAKNGTTESGFKVQRIADAGHKGLSIEIRPDGGMSWRFRYLFNGKANMVSLGTYPEISIAEVRKRTVEARETVAHKRPQQTQKGGTERTFRHLFQGGHAVAQSKPQKIRPR